MNVTGINTTVKNINKINTNINGKMNTISTDILEQIQNRSIQNLDNMSHTPISDDSIRNPSNWNIDTLSNNEYNLNCKSNHAAVVELGSPSRGIVGKHYVNSTIYELLPSLNEYVRNSLKKEL